MMLTIAIPEFDMKDVCDVDADADADADADC